MPAALCGQGHLRNFFAQNTSYEQNIDMHVGFVECTTKSGLRR